MVGWLKESGRRGAGRTQPKQDDKDDSDDRERDCGPELSNSSSNLEPTAPGAGTTRTYGGAGARASHGPNKLMAAAGRGGGGEEDRRARQLVEDNPPLFPARHFTTPPTDRHRLHTWEWPRFPIPSRCPNKKNITIFSGISITVFRFR